MAISFHVVFTLPTEVADIAPQNKAIVYDLLFRAASETMMTIAADPKHLGARIGINVDGGRLHPDLALVHLKPANILSLRRIGRPQAALRNHHFDSLGLTRLYVPASA